METVFSNFVGKSKSLLEAPFTAALLPIVAAVSTVGLRTIQHAASKTFITSPFFPAAVALPAIVEIVTKILKGRSIEAELLCATVAATTLTFAARAAVTVCFPAYSLAGTVVQLAAFGFATALADRANKIALSQFATFSSMISCITTACVTILAVQAVLS